VAHGRRADDLRQRDGYSISSARLAAPETPMTMTDPTQ